MSNIDLLNIKLSPEIPPYDISKKAKIKWGRGFDDGIIFVFGDVIYTKYQMSEDLYQHEVTHVRQQHKFGDPKKWWDFYFFDDQFRLEQELEAYKNQYNYLKKHTKDRERLHKLALDIARELSSPLYGEIISAGDALKAIRSG